MLDPFVGKAGVVAALLGSVAKVFSIAPQELVGLITSGGDAGVAELLESVAKGLSIAIGLRI